MSSPPLAAEIYLSLTPTTLVWKKKAKQQERFSIERFPGWMAMFQEEGLNCAEFFVDKLAGERLKMFT